jgi:elongation factor Ts
MKVSLDSIKKIRHMTSASVAECKKALEEADENIDKAVVLLRKRGLELAAKKQGSGAKEGRIEAYVHLGNKIGVLLEVNCQTDFVARNSEFCQFTKDVAMQIAACNPAYLKREDATEDVLAAEKDRELFIKNNCLLEQPFVKDPSITIKDYLGSLIAKFSENITINKFMRYKIGE